MLLALISTYKILADTLSELKWWI